eukprot:TRINITY_DN100512_c0_g1_i1.p1 TRINITY_DN100512_c0_g1~~TRINITY_DN100512_c0_g1_i1.p1  ORF type:complete len:664 (+),score=100.69 TRINITY_DN100512_c0_g1_i1:64-2055(+)
MWKSSENTSTLAEGLELQNTGAHLPLYESLPERQLSDVAATSSDGKSFAVDSSIGSWTAVQRMIKTSFAKKEGKGKARVLAAACLLFILIETGMLMWYSQVHKQYMTALQEKDADGFYSGLRRVALLICFVIPVLACQWAASWLFKLEWRVALTNSLVRQYYGEGDSASSNMFYRLTLGNDIDNPDQRVCNDVSDFVEKTFTLVQSSTRTVANMLGFMGVLYSISPKACIGVCVYALFGTLVSVKGFAPIIMKYNLKTVKQEADMRYCLIRTRENAESIAFFNGSSAEFERFRTFFGTLIDTMYRRMYVQVTFWAFQDTFTYVTFAIPALLVGPAYLNGDVEFGTIGQAGMAFNIVLGGMSVIMNNLDTLTGIAVHAKRLESLQEAMDAERNAKNEDVTIKLKEPTSDEKGAGGQLPTLLMSNVMLTTPPREGALPQTIVDKLSCRVDSGESVLVVGESGIGKSSLLRAIAGLWTGGRGSIARSQGDETFFLPQKPYMFLGTLREQLLYPSLDTSISDDTLVQVLRDVNLEYLLEHHSLQSTQHWASLLSGGEQQRINFARLLLQHDVKLALLDEGTSACDEASEAKLYNCLKGRAQSFVSVGHRPALLQYHTHVLWLRREAPARAGLLSPVKRGAAEATWKFMTVAEYREAVSAECQGRTNQ